MNLIGKNLSTVRDTPERVRPCCSNLNAGEASGQVRRYAIEVFE